MKKFLSTLCTTSPDRALVMTRVVVAFVMFAHGAQKMLSWFGGHGLEWTIEKWSQWFELPAFATVLVAVAEFFGPMLLAFGFLTRIVSAATILIMAGAVYYVHFKWGFYMNWYNQSDRGEGFEYHILMTALCILLVWRGSGPWSVDAQITKDVKPASKP